MREAQGNIAIRWFAGYTIHEKLPDHSSVTRIRQRSDWGGWRFCFSLSVPLERRACGPHAIQDDGKLAGKRHGCLLSSDAFAEGFTPGLQARLVVLTG